MEAKNRLEELIGSGDINSLDAAKQEGFIKGWNEALRIHNVVGRSEQCCDKCGSEYYHTYKCTNTLCDNCIIHD